MTDGEYFSRSPGRTVQEAWMARENQALRPDGRPGRPACTELDPVARGDRVLSCPGAGAPSLAVEASELPAHPQMARRP